MVVLGRDEEPDAEEEVEEEEEAEEEEEEEAEEDEDRIAGLDGRSLERKLISVSLMRTGSGGIWCILPELLGIAEVL